MRIQEGYGIIFLEGTDYVLTRSRSKLQSCTEWGIKREREKEFSGCMNDVCWFQWGKWEMGLLQLYENQSYQGSNPSVFCTTNYTNAFTWNPNFLGESSLDCGPSGNRYAPPPFLKRRPDSVLSVNTLDMSKTTEIQITSNSPVAPPFSIHRCVFVVSYQMSPLISGSNFPFLSSASRWPHSYSARIRLRRIMTTQVVFICFFCGVWVNLSSPFLEKAPLVKLKGQTSGS